MANLSLKSFLARFNIWSLVILAAADMSGVIDFSGLGWIITTFGVGTTAAVVIFLNEWYSDGKFKESIIDALIAWVLIAIPGPFVGPLILGAKIVV